MIVDLKYSYMNPATKEHRETLGGDAKGIWHARSDGWTGVWVDCNGVVV